MAVFLLLVQAVFCHVIHCYFIDETSLHGNRTGCSTSYVVHLLEHAATFLRCHRGITIAGPDVLFWPARRLGRNADISASAAKANIRHGLEKIVASPLGFE